MSERPLSATATFEQRLARVWESAPDEAGWVTTTDHKRIGERYIVTAGGPQGVGARGLERLCDREQLSDVRCRQLDADEHPAAMLTAAA